LIKKFLLGASTPFVKLIFTLNSCSAIIGNLVFCFEKESELLEAFGEFIRLIDPDIITGYNILNFDSPYLVNRANALKADSFCFIGRIKNSRTKVRDAKFSSKQMGTREYKELNTEGRIQFDIFVSIVQNYKLRSYTLNAVSYHFLKEQKEDVHHSIISDLQEGDDNDRRRLAVYCLKDALLPIRSG
jgi:DNA polymerase delta subunit 1